MSKDIPVRQWKRLEARYRSAWWRVSEPQREGAIFVAFTGDLDFHTLVSALEAGADAHSNSQ